MEKETKRNTYVLPGNGEMGSVRIADEVIAVISGMVSSVSADTFLLPQ